MRILFKNAQILTMYDKDVIDGIIQVKDRYNLIVNNNIIEFIGNDSDKDVFIKNNKLDINKDFERIIDVKGNVLMPGLVNTHTHSPMTFLRNYADHLPLHEWLFENNFPMEAKLTDEDVYWFTKMACLEYLSSGTTYVFDMYMHLMSVVEAFTDIGIRSGVTDSVTSHDKDPLNQDKLYIKVNNDKKYNKLCKYHLAAHSEYLNDEKTFSHIRDLVHEYKEPYYSHNSETKQEVEDCKKRWGGKTPMEVQDSFNLYDYGGGSIHSVWLNDNDIEICKNRNISIITCPSSNLKLASGIAPIKKYKDKGLNISIGTDGPASNNALSMFREMYLTSTLQKYINSDPRAISETETLFMATSNGAKTMHKNDIGELVVGKKADIIEIDIHTPNMSVTNKITNALLYSCESHNVILTMIDGKILYENGNFNIGEDIEYIYKKVNELSLNIKKR